MRSIKFAWVALLSSVFGSVLPVHASDTYNFTLMPIQGYNFTANGTFTLSGSGDISLVSGSINFPTYTISLTTSSPISYITHGNFYAYFMGSPGQYMNQLTLMGNLTSSNGNYSGVVQTGGYNVAGTGFFEAMLSSSAEGGSGGSSGGAPSPEVNTILGLAMAAGTVAFLRRRRRGHGERVEA